MSGFCARYIISGIKTRPIPYCCIRTSCDKLVFLKTKFGFFGTVYVEKSGYAFSVQRGIRLKPKKNFCKYSLTLSKIIFLIFNEKSAWIKSHDTVPLRTQQPTLAKYLLANTEVEVIKLALCVCLIVYGYIPDYNCKNFNLN